ncbi:hypothetical protein C4D60_Mb02t18480 [Musa balbisiana]|uniref:Uncharacterized protein n=1 Tax=Musa balbisiana TaxID=52838 RepID=A0A4S8IBR6_MUSBA|nr:hypothetical protein C4D60_Mb02t18480 [Musa balbisiana]
MTVDSDTFGVDADGINTDIDNCLAASDNDKVCSHRDTTRLHEERIVDLITARPMSLCICVNANADGGNRHDVYDEDGDRLAAGPLRGFAFSVLMERLLISPGRRTVAITTTRLFNIDTLRDYDDDNRDVGLERRPNSPTVTHRHCTDSFPSLRDAKSRFLCDAKVLDMFNPTWSLSQVLNQTT